MNGLIVLDEGSARGIGDLPKCCLVYIRGEVFVQFEDGRWG